MLGADAAGCFALRGGVLCASRQGALRFAAGCCELTLHGADAAGWRLVESVATVLTRRELEPLIRTSYELVVASKKEKFEVVLDKDGKVTKQEDKSKRKSKQKDND